MLFVVKLCLWLRNYSKICKQIQVLILLRRYFFLCVFLICRIANEPSGL
ncbi:hypothetical protein HanPI659440_Chr05g0192751 [Helianthus annuus]|nr:hypothetical protein HanPI659440_Chr05g0192751 [Helianthus annuus]